MENGQNGTICSRSFKILLLSRDFFSTLYPMYLWLPDGLFDSFSYTAVVWFVRFGNNHCLFVWPSLATEQRMYIPNRENGFLRDFGIDWHLIGT